MGYHKSLVKAGSRGLVLAALAGFLAGCGEGAKLVQETESGGTVTYPFKSDPGIGAFRKQALSLIEQRCGGSYTIVKEGEAKGRIRVTEVAGVAGSQDAITERRWGIQFLCK
jgi:hypothetical protein